MTAIAKIEAAKDASKGDYRADPLVIERLLDTGWFRDPGVYAVVDGQFGSTGKGLLSCVMGEVASITNNLTVATANAGPNSGHTAYDPATGEKIVTQQLPISSIVYNRLAGHRAVSYMNAGSIIDIGILNTEICKYAAPMRTAVIVHPHAAVIEDIDREREAGGSTAKIASTAKGTGSALARKIMREGNVYQRFYDEYNVGNTCDVVEWDWSNDVVSMELSQGFSLGVNSGLYPYTTSRECTVMQGLSDAIAHPSFLRRVAACYRTFPIRVGNTDKGNSGGCYPDQHEISYEDIGQPVEFTTVTKRPRRIFTWSRQQFRDSIAANRPNVVFLNFCQYMTEAKLNELIEWIYEDYRSIMIKGPDALLLGYGPTNADVRLA